MNLQINESNGVTVVTMNANGERVTQVVVDPANAYGPMETKDWVHDMGGTVPIEEGKADGDPGLARLRPR